MKPVRLGTVVCHGVPVYVEEEPVDTLALSKTTEFTVLLGIQGAVLDVGLSEIRALKRLMHKAEQQLLLRQEQALRSKNYVLDL